MRVKNFLTGAQPKNSNVAASTTVRIPTSVVTIPVTKYGQGGKRRKKR